MVKLSIPDIVLKVYPYIGDQRARFRLGDLVELTGLPASTCHKILNRMARYGIITKQSKRSRIWIKKFDKISEWIQNHIVMEVKDIENSGEFLIKKIGEEEKPL